MSLLTSMIPAFQRPLARRDNANGAARENGPTVRPAYEVKETDDAYGVVVHLPGVTKETLEISADAEALTVVGRRAWKRPESWTQLYRESNDAGFELTLSHDNAIDVEKVHAELRDGILRISLPKAEAIKPRKIAVS